VGRCHRDFQRDADPSQQLVRFSARRAQLTRAARPSGESGAVAESIASCPAGGERVSLTDHPAIAMNEENDRRGREQRADLQQDEDRVMAVHGQDADEDAAHEPHGPRAAAHACRTMLASEVNQLREIGEHRDCDACHADELEHPAQLAARAQCRGDRLSDLGRRRRFDSRRMLRLVRAETFASLAYGDRSPALPFPTHQRVVAHPSPPSPPCVVSLSFAPLDEDRDRLFHPFPHGAGSMREWACDPMARTTSEGQPVGKRPRGEDMMKTGTIVSDVRVVPG